MEKRERKAISKRWKAVEDWFCKHAGLKQMGHLRRGVSCPDGVNDMFSVEIVFTSKELAWLNKEMRDAEKNAASYRTPLLVIFQAGKRREDGFAIHRVGDWLGIHGKG